MPSRKRRNEDAEERRKKDEAILEAAIKEMRNMKPATGGLLGSGLNMGVNLGPPQKLSSSGNGGNWSYLPPSVVAPLPTFYNFNYSSPWDTPPAPAAPKLEVATAKEVIVGYRVWTLKRYYPEGYRLDAMNANLSSASEPYQRFVAECRSGIELWGYAPPGYAYPPKRHKAPEQDCNCGWHAYKTSVPLEPSAKPYVAGEVNLWGRVIEHEAGYRAEFAYPKSLVVVDGGDRAEHIATALTLTYGVPCEVWQG